MNEEIRQALKWLAHVSTLLIKLENRFDEMEKGPSELFERAFFNESNQFNVAAKLLSRSYGENEALKLNKNDKSLVLKFTNSLHYIKQ